MRTRVKCSCGWTRELSEFYAGKRIRCADCDTVLEVPGVSDGLYSAHRLERELNHPAPRQGVWLPLTHRPDAHVPRVHKPEPQQGRHFGNSLFLVLIAVIIALNVGRILQDGREMEQERKESTPLLEAPVDEPEPQATPAADDQDEDADLEDEF